MKHIGTSHKRHDALGKVTGDAMYAADLFPPGMLRLKTVFAHRPSARILEIDASAALAVPGVVAVLTAADVPYNAYGLIDSDQPVLCGDVVRHYGDRVALVVAESEVRHVGGQDDLTGHGPLEGALPGDPRATVTTVAVAIAPVVTVAVVMVVVTLAATWIADDAGHASDTGHARHSRDASSARRAGGSGGTRGAGRSGRSGGTRQKGQGDVEAAGLGRGQDGDV